MRPSSKLRDVLFTHMDEMSYQMDVLSSLSEISRQTAININNIVKSIEKGRCVNRNIENLIKDTIKERVA